MPRGVYWNSPCGASSRSRIKGCHMRKLNTPWLCCLLFSLAGGVFILSTSVVGDTARGQQSVFSPEVVIQLQPVVTTGLSSPVYVTNARDLTNRIFIVEQSGRI